MTLALWMVLAFAGWTLLVLTAGVGVGRWGLIAQGKAELTSFPGDTPHGGPALRRAVRAHANCVENLPVFASVVLVGSVAGFGSSALDALAVTVVCARIIQTSVHMVFRESNVTIGVRFSFFLVQVMATFAMGALITAAASRVSY
jgi:uncharacterized MAPEG superfamily protein